MHTDGDLLAQIVRRVDLVEVARRMVAVFHAEIPAYRTLPDTMLQGEILDIAQRNLGMFFRTLADARPLSDEELKPICESARQRAAEGLPLEDLLHAYRLGGRLGWPGAPGGRGAGRRPAREGHERRRDPARRQAVHARLTR